MTVTKEMGLEQKMYTADKIMEKPNSVSPIPHFCPVGSLHHETSFAVCRWIGTGPVAGQETVVSSSVGRIKQFAHASSA